MSALSNDVRPRLLLAREALFYCLEGSARQALSADSVVAMSKALDAVREALVAVDAQLQRCNVPQNKLGK